MAGTLKVLRELVDAGGDSNDSAMLKHANIAKLHEALSDHRTIGDTVNSKQQRAKVKGLLKELLSDPDARVRQGAGGVLGLLETLIPGARAEAAAAAGGVPAGSRLFGDGPGLAGGMGHTDIAGIGLSASGGVGMNGGGVAAGSRLFEDSEENLTEASLASTASGTKERKREKERE